MLNVVILSVVILSVVILGVVMLSIFIQSVVILNVVAPQLLIKTGENKNIFGANLIIFFCNLDRSEE
jgi:hypothetical protein